MKRFSILILVLAISNLNVGNSLSFEYWDIVYNRSGRDKATSIQQTMDGGYVVAGFSEPYWQGPDENCVWKLDSNGDIMWQKVYGSSLITS